MSEVSTEFPPTTDLLGHGGCLDCVTMDTPSSRPRSRSATTAVIAVITVITVRGRCHPAPVEDVADAV